jgi:hypothetical protein
MMPIRAEVKRAEDAYVQHGAGVVTYQGRWSMGIAE